MYTSRFTLGYNTEDPITGADLGDRYVTIVDYADDASHARNLERMHHLWGKTYAFPYSEDTWTADMVERYRMVEHARFEFGREDHTRSVAAFLDESGSQGALTPVGIASALMADECPEGCGGTVQAHARGCSIPAAEVVIGRMMDGRPITQPADDCAPCEAAGCHTFADGCRYWRPPVDAPAVCGRAS